MNPITDLMNPNANGSGPPFVTAILMGVVNEQPVNWAFPVLVGTARDVVQAEIRNRCTGDYASLASDPSTQITYPAGPWTAPLTPDNPPIGVRPPVPESAPRPQTPPPQPRPAPDLGPLPEPHVRQPTDQAACMDLEAMLAAWRQKYQLTSAEYLAYLFRVLSFQTNTLVAHERRRKPNAG